MRLYWGSTVDSLSLSLSNQTMLVIQLFIRKIDMLITHLKQFLYNCAEFHLEEFRFTQYTCLIFNSILCFNSGKFLQAILMLTS